MGSRDRGGDVKSGSQPFSIHRIWRYFTGQIDHLTQSQTLVVWVGGYNKLCRSDMHGKAGKIDFRQEHFHKDVFRCSTDQWSWFDDQVTFCIQPIIEVVTMNTAALDKVSVCALCNPLSHILQKTGY